jgi:hypothetical protein
MANELPVLEGLINGELYTLQIKNGQLAHKFVWIFSENCKEARPAALLKHYPPPLPSVAVEIVFHECMRLLPSQHLGPARYPTMRSIGNRKHSGPKAAPPGKRSGEEFTSGLLR